LRGKGEATGFSHGELSLQSLKAANRRRWPRMHTRRHWQGVVMRPSRRPASSCSSWPPTASPSPRCCSRRCSLPPSPCSSATCWTVRTGEYGLPREMSIRIGLHTGPVFEGIDPITGALNYYGSPGGAGMASGLCLRIHRHARPGAKLWAPADLSYQALPSRSISRFLRRESPRRAGIIGRRFCHAIRC